MLTSYLFRKQWMTLNDDFIINSTDSEDGESVAYRVTNKLLHIREIYMFEDTDGNDIYKIMERNCPNHRVCLYDGDDTRVATVRKRSDGTYWAHVDDERDVYVTGDIESGLVFSNVGGMNIARMTESWLFPGLAENMMQIDIRADQDDPLIMAIAVACQYLAGDDGDDEDDDPDTMNLPLGAITFKSAYLFRTEWGTVGDNFVINKLGGDDVGWYVNHKLLRARKMYHLENEDNELIYRIRELVEPRQRILIEDAEKQQVGVIRKKGDGSYWCRVDDERDIFAVGDASNGELELNNLGGLSIASLRPSDGVLFPDTDLNMVLVRDDQDEDLIIAVLVGVQYLLDAEGDDEEDEDFEEEDSEED